MQRRQKQSLKPSSSDGGIGSPSTPNSPALPLHNRRQVPKQQARIIRQRNGGGKRSSSCSFIKCMVQLIIVLLLAITITIMYMAIHGLKSQPDADIKTMVQGEIKAIEGEIKTIEGEFVDFVNKVEGDVLDRVHDHGNPFKSDADTVPDKKEPEIIKAEPEPEPVQPVENIRPKRTTAEANAYMASQPSDSVDGEKALKEKLRPLYDKQQKDNEEDSSPIITRWLGRTAQDEFGEDLQYWLPKSSTSDEEIEAWKLKVDKLYQIDRMKDEEQFPILHNIQPPSLLGKSDNTSNASSSNANGSLVYPSPAKDGTRPIIQPTFGIHRMNVDAVFALAEGYDLKIYLLFIESLKKTGFEGDLVISVSSLDELKPDVEDYLRSFSKKGGESGLNVVAYTVTWTCYEGDGVTVAKGAKEGVRKCEMVGMYGLENGDKTVRDPREARPVATARFELYWAWSLHYDEHSWIMLIDSRDTYFQSNPFANVERDARGSPDGLLYFFEVRTNGLCLVVDSIFVRIAIAKIYIMWSNCMYYNRTIFYDRKTRRLPRSKTQNSTPGGSRRHMMRVTYKSFSTSLSYAPDLPWVNKLPLNHTSVAWSHNSTILNANSKDVIKVSITTSITLVDYRM